MRPNRRAFSLMELLVVIAIIALLIAILLPGLRSARESARAARCGTLLRGLAGGLNTYATEEAEWLPGINTTGVALRQHYPAQDPDVLRRPDLPVQSYDWMTPVLRLETVDLGTSRGERFYRLLRDYGCPSQAGLNSVLFKNPPDSEDFKPLAPWPAVSYLMPAHFQLWGGRQWSRVLGKYEGGGQPILPEVVVPYPLDAPQGGAFRDWEVDTGDYVSKLTRVGTPARKIAVADGTRYLPNNLILDHDVMPLPSNFGSFTDGGGWWFGSTAYGAEGGSQNWDGVPTSPQPHNPSGGRNLPLTYRHGASDPDAAVTTVRQNRGAINAAFFDGHVARLTDRASRDIQYWYPTGGRARGKAASTWRA